MQVKSTLKSLLTENSALAQVTVFPVPCSLCINVPTQTAPSGRIVHVGCFSCPTVALRIGNHTPLQLATELGRRGFFTWDGNYYALNLTEYLGRREGWRLSADRVGAFYAVLVRLPATSFSLRLAGVVAEVFAVGLEAFGASFAARL